MEREIEASLLPEFRHMRPYIPQNVMSLQNQCFWYLIQNLHLIPANSLLLLPQSMRYKLLHNLPAMEIWQLEATPFTDNLDLEKVWEVLLKKRCTFPVNALSRLPGRCSRDRYFAAVWKTLLRTLNMTDEKFSRLLFEVPNPLDLKERELYRLPQLTPKAFCYNDPGVISSLFNSRKHHSLKLVAMIRYFSEVCLMQPRKFEIDCIEIGKYLLPLHLQTSGEILQQFMGQVHYIRINGHGVIPKPHYRALDQHHDLVKRFFIHIPKHFIGAAVSTPHCNLSSLTLDMGDVRRALDVLRSIASAFSNTYNNLMDFCVIISNWIEDCKHWFLNFLEDLQKLLDSQPLLQSFVAVFPAETYNYLSKTKEIPACLEAVKCCVSFASFLQKFVRQPHFKSLILRNVLSPLFTQDLIVTFLSFIPSHSQLLDICTSGSKSVPHGTMRTSPSKTLKFSGIQLEGKISLTKWFFQLPNVILDRLEVVDAPENIHTALQDTVEHLHIKSLSIVLRPHIEEVPAPRAVVPIQRPPLQVGHRYYRQPVHKVRQLSDPIVPVAVLFPLAPHFGKLLNLSALHSLGIKFQESSHFLANVQVGIFLSTLSAGLEIQAEVSILQKLKLPKLDMFNVEDKPVLTFFNALFSLPQLETFRLNLSALNFSSHHTGLIHSSWQSHSRGRRLAKFTIHHLFDNCTAAATHDLDLTLLKQVCLDCVYLQHRISDC